VAIDPIFSDAIIFASLLALLSIGLTLTYITTRVPNFAHASFATIGIYIALIATRVWDTSPYIAIPIAFVISGIVAVALYTFILKPLIRKGASQAIQMVATLAFDLVMIAMLNITADFIVKTYQVTSREFSLRSYDAEFLGFPLIVFVAPITIAILAITLHIMLRKTKFGIAMRAATENSDLAGIVGPPVASVEVGEKSRDHQAEPPLKDLDPLDLRRDQCPQLGRHVNRPCVPVLGAARLEPQRPFLQINLRQGQAQHLRLHAPAELVGDADSDLHVYREPLADRLKLVRLEEPLAGWGRFELVEDRHPQQLAVLVRDAEHLDKRLQLPVDRRVCPP